MILCHAIFIATLYPKELHVVIGHRLEMLDCRYAQIQLLKIYEIGTWEKLEEKRHG